MNTDAMVRQTARVAANMYLVLQAMRLPADQLRLDFALYRLTLENYASAAAVCQFGPCRALQDPAAFVAAFLPDRDLECRVAGVTAPCPVEIGGWIEGCSQFLRALWALMSVEMGFGDPGPAEEEPEIRERGLVAAIYSPLQLVRVVRTYPSLLMPDELVYRAPRILALFEESFQVGLRDAQNYLTGLRVDILGRDEVGDDPSPDGGAPPDPDPAPTG